MYRLTNFILNLKELNSVILFIQAIKVILSILGLSVTILISVKIDNGSDHANLGRLRTRGHSCYYEVKVSLFLI